MDEKFNMTIKEVCEATGLSRITLYNWRKANARLSFQRNNLTGRVLYNREEVEAAVRNANE